MANCARRRVGGGVSINFIKLADLLYCTYRARRLKKMKNKKRKVKISRQAQQNQRFEINFIFLKYPFDSVFSLFDLHFPPAKLHYLEHLSTSRCKATAS
jgi:hypothetical protein